MSDEIETTYHWGLKKYSITNCERCPSWKGRSYRDWVIHLLSHQHQLTIQRNFDVWSSALNEDLVVVVTVSFEKEEIEDLKFFEEIAFLISSHFPINEFYYRRGHNFCVVRLESEKNVEHLVKQVLFYQQKLLTVRRKSGLSPFEWMALNYRAEYGFDHLISVDSTVTVWPRSPSPARESVEEPLGISFANCYKLSDSCGEIISTDIEMQDESDVVINGNSFLVLHDNICEELESFYFLEDQLAFVFSKISMSLTDIDKRSNIFAKLSQVLQSDFPGCRLHSFGLGAGMMGAKQDVYNIFVDVKNILGRKATTSGVKLHLDKEELENVIHKMYRLLIPLCRPALDRQNSSFGRDLTKTLKEKNKYLQFIHIESGTPCCLTFKMTLEFQNTKLIEFLISLDARVRPLMLFILYWMRYYQLLDRINVYPMTLLIIVFLNEKRILPPISLLKSLENSSDKVIVNGWDYSFCNDPTLVSVNAKAQGYLPDFEANQITGLPTAQSILKLAEGFFTFYARANFKRNIVCSRVGKLMKKEIFSWENGFPELPESLKDFLHGPNGLRSKESIKRFDFQKMTLCIQDPCNLLSTELSNCSEGGDNLVIKFQEACAELGRKLTTFLKGKAGNLLEIFHPNPFGMVKIKQEDIKREKESEEEIAISNSRESSHSGKSSNSEESSHSGKSSHAGESLHSEESSHSGKSSHSEESSHSGKSSHSRKSSHSEKSAHSGKSLQSGNSPNEYSNNNENFTMSVAHGSEILRNSEEIKISLTISDFFRDLFDMGLDNLPKSQVEIKTKMEVLWLTFFSEFMGTVWKKGFHYEVSSKKKRRWYPVKENIMTETEDETLSVKRKCFVNVKLLKKFEEINSDCITYIQRMKLKMPYSHLIWKQRKEAKRSVQKIGATFNHPMQKWATLMSLMITGAGENFLLPVPMPLECYIDVRMDHNAAIILSIKRLRSENETSMNDLIPKSILSMFLEVIPTFQQYRLNQWLKS